MATTRIEYAVAETEDLEIQVLLGEDRERALRMAERWNASTPGSVIVMTRTVVTTDWQPANTGVVPPYTREKVDGVHGEGPGQGEDDRGREAGDG